MTRPTISSTQTPDPTTLTSLELFAGAGGMALGLAQAGFEHVAVVECDQVACDSLRANAKALGVDESKVSETDARKFDFGVHAGRIDLLAAGAPCQPFSVGGKHSGHADERNMFPTVLKAVQQIRPRTVLIENVPGLARPTMRPYLDYVKLRLRYPEHRPRRSERWQGHARRLSAYDASPRRRTAPSYIVDHFELNAADFGIPQARRRLFIVATRADLRCDWTLLTRRLEPTHSRDALLYAKWIEGTYWAQHGFPLYELPVPLPSKHMALLDRMRSDGPPSTARWLTVYDALRSTNDVLGWRPLPEPVNDVQHPEFLNHVGRDGARIYTGHTGSTWHEPAKTLKAGSHGVPGGENIICLDDGQVRYFTVREAARLQGFPDTYKIEGAWTRGFKQLGNAVPVGLAKTVANALKLTITAATATGATAAA